jgi:hypothetical protein
MSDTHSFIDTEQSTTELDRNTERIITPGGKI